MATLNDHPKSKSYRNSSKGKRFPDWLVGGPRVGHWSANQVSPKKGRSSSTVKSLVEEISPSGRKPSGITRTWVACLGSDRRSLLDFITSKVVSPSTHGLVLWHGSILSQILGAVAWSLSLDERNASSLVTRGKWLKNAKCTMSRKMKSVECKLKQPLKSDWQKNVKGLLGWALDGTGKKYRNLNKHICYDGNI